MSKPDWQKIKEVFYQTLDLNEAERKDFLARQGEAVRVEIEELLAAHERSKNFISQPALVELGFQSKTYVGQKIGNYTLLEIIGTGGMGTVFLAEKAGLEKKFAIKLIKRGMDTDEVLRRFKLERQILARLEHQNITPLLDGGMTDGGLPFLTMEYVKGVSITRFCDTNHLDLKERLKLFRQVCSAVNYAHQNLIIHRDLKPSNILVTKTGVPKLLDFGIAKLLDPDHFENTATTMKSRMFTPEYASPEQINGLPITTASDVYSLGVVLYELLSGQRPFQTQNRSYQEIVKQILTEEPQKPSSVVRTESKVQSPKSAAETITYNGKQTSDEKHDRKPQIENPKSLRGDLDNIILKTLRKEPERRYNSVQEFSEDIRRHLEGLPVTATADTFSYRFSKFYQRHKTGVLIGAVVSILIFSLSGIAVTQGIIATRERQKAEKRLKDIREVAKSLMNETNDSLNKIPGNIGVQKALTEKSVALLDSLANDETNDETLLIELADAYTKLAAIQNYSFREFDKSFANIKKAEAIYKKILATKSDDIEIRRKLYQAQMRLIESLKETDRRDKVFQVHYEAIENQQNLIRIEPDNMAHPANLAALYGGFGGILNSYNKKAEAMENFRNGIGIIDRAIEQKKSKENSPKTISEISRFLHTKGWLLNGLGENEKAIENYLESAELAAGVYLEKEAITDTFLRIVGSYEMIGDIYAKENDFKSAFENYMKAKKAAETALKNKSLANPGTVQINNCAYTVKVATMLERSGNRKDALRYFVEGENICRQNLKQNPDQSDTILVQIEDFYEISNFYFTKGERRRSISILLELTIKMETFLEKNESDLETAFVLAETYEKIGDFQNEDRTFYDKSNKIWSKYQQTYRLLPTEKIKMEQLRKKL